MMMTRSTIGCLKKTCPHRGANLHQAAKPKQPAVVLRRSHVLIQQAERTEPMPLFSTTLFLGICSLLLAVILGLMVEQVTVDFNGDEQTFEEYFSMDFSRINLIRYSSPKKLGEVPYVEKLLFLCGVNDDMRHEITQEVSRIDKTSHLL